jgi:hypothetical protein
MFGKSHFLCCLLGIAILALSFTTLLRAEYLNREAPAKSIADEDLAPLPIELPRAMFTSCPTGSAPRSPNLEKQPVLPRAPFMAPRDAVILSRGKNVISSDGHPRIGKTEQITDGEKSHFDTSFVEYRPGLHFVQIDLEEPHELYALVIWHFQHQARVYFDVIVRIADDEDFSTNVRTLFNNDHDNSSGLGKDQDKEYIETLAGKLVNGHKETARYIRLYSNGNTRNKYNHYIEVEVWGKGN